MSVAVDSRAKVAFHDAEHGGYRADLPLWEELAETFRGPVLDLGAGTGRVSLPLLAAGHDVIAVDIDADLLAELSSRADGLPGTLTTIAGDARLLGLPPASAGLIVAPMQFFHLIGGAQRRSELLGRLAAILEPGSTLAAAVLEDAATLVTGEADAALPDVREQDGHVYSSLPLAIRGTGEGIELVRRRQIVGPDGDLTEETHVIALDRLDPGTLEADGRQAGFLPRGRRVIPETGEHVGSICVLLEAPGG